MNVLIFGAGSIGNHLANASRNLDWNVTIFDIDPKALRRTKEEIYPSRYGNWDEAIQLIDNLEELRISPDLIIVGTPPESHIKLAVKAMNFQPKAILIEKPLCPPSREGLKELIDKSRISKTKFFVGYNHILGKASNKVAELIKTKDFGETKSGKGMVQDGMQWSCTISNRPRWCCQSHCSPSLHSRRNNTWFL